jgi:thioredoxin-related protein
MRFLPVLAITITALCAFTNASTNWHYNLDEAKQIAAKEHKYILLNFSGSDWCGPCIHMHKEIFDDTLFQQFAGVTLVMVNADFPRNKKNQLSKEQQALNDKMADAYNKQGAFPYTVLLDADGKVLKAWDGYPKETVPAFIEDIKEAIHAGNHS